jgi:UDP-N-acetylglucosamine:LPS N-acetylglucosamine transferase
MKRNLRILFTVQGEGRGHLTQAISLADMLRRNGHEIVDVLVGKSHSRDLPAFFYEKINAPVTIYEAPTLIFKKDKKHINKTKTFIHNANVKKIMYYGDSIVLINKHIKELNPDLLINFYEILPGFAQLRFRIDTPFVHIGHQFLLRHPDYAHGKEEGQSHTLLRLHATVSGFGATKTLALSFYPMKSFPREHLSVVPPILRKEVLELKPTTGDYILGYMLNQGYENEVRAWHKKNPEVKLHFFWDKKDAPEELIVDDTLTLHKINDELFLKYMAGCKGYITTAGFESVCEAMYLNKPVLMIPAHIEQEINAADAESIGGGIVGENFNLSPLLDYIEERQTRPEDLSFQQWVHSAEEMIINHINSILA